MFIWAGIDVDDELGEVKEKALLIDNSINFANSCFVLPLHISLKAAFQIDKSIFEEIALEISNYFKTIKPFEIAIDKIEMYDNIIWIRMKRCTYLDKVHDELNNILQEKYNIKLHEYDLDYKYHTTLFMDSNKDSIKEAYDLIKGVELPQKINANQFVIGTSETGELGTYKIYKKVKTL